MARVLQQVFSGAVLPFLHKYVLQIPFLLVLAQLLLVIGAIRLTGPRPSMLHWVPVAIIPLRRPLLVVVTVLGGNGQPLSTNLRLVHGLSLLVVPTLPELLIP